MSKDIAGLAASVIFSTAIVGLGTSVYTKIKTNKENAQGDELLDNLKRFTVDSAEDYVSKTLGDFYAARVNASGYNQLGVVDAFHVVLKPSTGRKNFIKNQLEALDLAEEEAMLHVHKDVREKFQSIFHTIHTRARLAISRSV